MGPQQSISIMLSEDSTSTNISTVPQEEELMNMENTTGELEISGLVAKI